MKFPNKYKATLHRKKIGDYSTSGTKSQSEPHWCQTYTIDENAGVVSSTGKDVRNVRGASKAIFRADQAAASDFGDLVDGK